MAIAEIHLHVERGEDEFAYAKWCNQLVLSKNILAGTDDWIGKSLGLVMFSETLALLDNILALNPQLARKYGSELASLLQMNGMEAFNFNGVLRADYSVLKLFLETSPEMTRIGHRIGCTGWSTTLDTSREF